MEIVRSVWKSSISWHGPQHHRNGSRLFRTHICIETKSVLGHYSSLGVHRLFCKSLYIIMSLLILM